MTSQDQPPAESLEVLSQGTNAWVVRTPGRRYPGMVLQGDTLHSMLHLATKIREGLLQSENEELRDLAAELEEQLSTRMRVYEAVLQQDGFGLPYTSITRPGE